MTVERVAVGSRWSLVAKGQIMSAFAMASGLLVALLLLFLLDSLPLLGVLSRDVGYWFVPALGFVAVGIAWLLGGVYAKRVLRGRNAYLQGLLLAYSVLIVCLFAVALPFALLDSSTYVFGVGHAVKSYFLHPLFWLLVVGGVPAAVLGVAWGAVMRVRSTACAARKLGC